MDNDSLSFSLLPGQKQWIISLSLVELNERRQMMDFQGLSYFSSSLTRNNLLIITVSHIRSVTLMKCFFGIDFLTTKAYNDNLNFC